MAKVAEVESIVSRMRSRLFVAVLRDDKETEAAERIRAYVAVQFKTSRADYDKSGVFVVRRLTDLGWDDDRIGAASLIDIEARVVPLEFIVPEEPEDMAPTESDKKSTDLIGVRFALRGLAACLENECLKGPTKYISQTVVAGDPLCPDDCTSAIVTTLRTPTGPFPATLESLDHCVAEVEGRLRPWCPDLAREADGLLCEVEGIASTKVETLSQHTRDEVALLCPKLRTLAAKVEREKRAIDDVQTLSGTEIFQPDTVEKVSPPSTAKPGEEADLPPAVSPVASASNHNQLLKPKPVPQGNETIPLTLDEIGALLAPDHVTHKGKWVKTRMKRGDIPVNGDLSNRGKKTTDYTIFHREKWYLVLRSDHPALRR